MPLMVRKCRERRSKRGECCFGKHGRADDAAFVSFDLKNPARNFMYGRVERLSRNVRIAARTILVSF